MLENQKQKNRCSNNVMFLCEVFYRQIFTPNHQNITVFRSRNRNHHFTNNHDKKRESWELLPAFIFVILLVVSHKSHICFHLYLR